MRDRRRPNHAAHPAMRSRISEASMTQSPYDRHVSYTRTGNKRAFGRTWSSDGAHLHTAEAMYSIVYDGIQGDIDGKGNEG